MADVIDFKEKFKQKTKPKEAESATDADTEPQTESPPASRDEDDPAKPTIEEEQPEGGPADTSSDEQACAGPMSNKHVDLLIFAVVHQADFFHTPEKEPFATVRSEDCYEPRSCIFVY